MPSYQRILDITIPTIAFWLTVSVGTDLTIEDFRKVRGSLRLLLIGTLGQYLLPLVALLIFKVFSPPAAILGGMVLLASSPAGGISNFYCYIGRANVALSVVMTAVSCLLAPFTMPLILKAFETLLGQRIDFNLPLGVLFGQLILLLVLPVFIGTVLRNHYSQFVGRWDKMFRRIGLLLLAALIGFILFQTRELFLANWQSIAETASIFVVLSMSVGWLVARAFRWNHRDSVTLVIEYGIRNVAIATTAAVVLLKRSEFATFSATYFLIEAVLILSFLLIYKRLFSIEAVA